MRRVEWTGKPIRRGRSRFSYIDHLTHNVRRGTWTLWYSSTRHFNFREIRYFNIAGKLTGLTSRALTSPCGNIRIQSTKALTTKVRSEELICAI